jgi:DNA-binding transcriptional LysR family regulator
VDKLVSMRTFVRIVELGSLTAAANELGTSLPTVVRALAVNRSGFVGGSYS